VWLDKVVQHGHGYHEFEEITPEQRFSEMMMMGLRLREGVAFAKIQAETGQDWRMVLAQDKVQHLVDEKMLDVSDTQIMPTREGMQRLNALLAYML
jgi:oxygen-independent coproporphyrinogen-3 oxidase